MRVAASSLLLLLLIGCYRDGRSVVIIAAHDISSQTVIQDSDVETVNASNVFKTYASIPAHTVRDRRDAVGHKALHSIAQGAPLNSRDID